MSELEKQIESIYQKLYELHGPQGWWPLISHQDTIPGYHPLNYDLPHTRNEIYEVILGTILTQNTSWRQAHQALLNLKEISGFVPEKFLKLNIDVLKSAIRCAGFLNQKSVYLKEITRFFIGLNGKIPSRKKLIQIKGVGNETADSILLYAYKQPEFVVDAYTRRIFSYLNLVDEKIKYLELKNLFQTNLPEDVPIYQEYHALIVEHAKIYYNKKPYGVGDPLK